MITDLEVLELEAAALPFWKVWKYKNSIPLCEITNGMVADFPENSLEEHILSLKKCFINARKEESMLALHAEILPTEGKNKNQYIKEKKVNDDAYNIRNKLQKRTSDIKQRLNKTASYARRLLAAKLLRANHKVIEKSDKPQKCRLDEHLCIRKPHRIHSGQITGCPMPDKFCLEDGICHPAKK